MAWVILFFAGILEVVWALLLKQSAGLTRLWPSVGFVISSVASVYLLSQSLKTLPVGTAYAVWTGIGAAGTAIFGMLFLGEFERCSKAGFVGSAAGWDRWAAHHE